MSHVYPDLRAAPLFATLEATHPDRHHSSEQRLARMRRCIEALASAWLTAHPGVPELTAVEFGTTALRLGRPSLVRIASWRACEFAFGFEVAAWQQGAPTPWSAAPRGTRVWLVIT